MENCIALSARGSMILPRSDIMFQWRAIKPSATSVMPEMTIIAAANMWSLAVSALEYAIIKAGTNNSLI